MSMSEALLGQTIVNTSEGNMVVRSLNDEFLQRNFDDWFEEKGYVTNTNSESRKGKKLNWNSRKTATCWKFFEQGAMEEDGRPVVKCLVCGAIYKHGGLYGPTAMAGHLSQPGHVKEGRILVYGNAFDSPIPTQEQILGRLKGNGNVGLAVSEELN